MIQKGIYRIYDENKSLDAESDKTTRSGYIETWENGSDTIYAIKGDLPQYMQNELARIAESRGYKYWYNNASFFDPRDYNTAGD